MRRLPTLLTLLVALSAACAAPATPPSAGAIRPDASPTADGDRARWERQARDVRITRDHWGIAHVHGRTDADAVFGMVYAQAEDDFNRIEVNYLTALGRLAEADGERAMWQDVRQRLFVDHDSLRADFVRSPAWLQRLMTAWADGLNFYLATHADVRPRVLTRFEPWMALAFSEGSIGGDIESISLPALEAFYRTRVASSAGSPGGSASGDEDLEGDPLFREPRGSNGFAIAPSNTANGRALLLINPHTSFFFRSELQMSSDEGLNAYGAATWGQFFIYQGFNERVGWMHTSSGVDVVDEFAELVVDSLSAQPRYRYGGEVRAMTVRPVTVRVRQPDGSLRTHRVTTYRTHHGPITHAENGRWTATALMHKPVAALGQSYLRTKARHFGQFMSAMGLKANSSNNTIYADADGIIAYMHPQFVPRRDDRFDYTRPVDGSDPATDWKGEHDLDELPFLQNPANGWIQNTNNWPYSAAGAHSPKRAAYPRYMDRAGENPRGLHAIMVLENRRDFTLDRLRDAAYDSYLPAFGQMVPALVRAYDAMPAADTLRRAVAEQVAALRAWDFRWGVGSVPTSLAVYWGEEMIRRVGADARRAGEPTFDFVATRAAPAQHLAALAAASDRLAADFGTWRTPWGEINRFQRLTGDIAQPFSDAGPSIAVGFTSAQWGSLASFGARTYPGTKRRYGTSGNSFVAVVEFGKDSVRARAVTAGGESGHPASPHFNDQAERYARGDLREVYFYPSQLAGRTERVYRPGER